MQLDTRIPLGVQQISIADILKNAEALRGAAQERAYRAQIMRRQNEQDQRDADFRSAAADYVDTPGAPPPQGPLPVAAPGDEPGAAPSPMGGSAFGDMSRASAPSAGGVDPLAPLPGPPGQNGVLASAIQQATGAGSSPPAASSPRSPHNEAFHRMVLADPKEAFAARDLQFKAADAHLDAIARLAGSAYDQPSYEAALQRASQMGLDISSLPRQFDPRVANQVLNEALSAKDRLASERANLKLQNDIEDDQADNERADENLDSLDAYRNGQLSNTRRGQDITDRRVRGSAAYSRQYGSGSGGQPPRSEQALYSDIRRRWMENGSVNPREKAWAEDYERRRNARDNKRGRGRGRVGGGGSSSGPPTVSTVEEARALPSGSVFYYQGKLMRKK